MQVQQILALINGSLMVINEDRAQKWAKYRALRHRGINRNNTGRLVRLNYFDGPVGQVVFKPSQQLVEGPFPSAV